MRVSPKQERSQIRTFEQLIRRYDLESLASIKQATENTKIGLNKTITSVEEFIKSTVGTLDNLQSQIDGNISTWFYNGVPTLENTPANVWISEKEKDTHLGDLYYDKDTGYGYRFSVTEGEYEWIKLTDNDVVEALAIANAAQDTADGKRRVFVAKPYPPYDEGDLWFNKDEIYICTVPKSVDQEYADEDFVIATKYTDDTKALEVEKNLNLVVARVDILQTNMLTAESAIIKDLQTDMLTAESAIIKELQTQVNKTDMLIFGSAGGTSIQTEFSNSVIAMLGDAQIKSAMIDSVSASKVTAGTIYTDDVTIQSEDGKTILEDNTLQISDGTRVRVQIGKDASNDYSINVWDASGKLMFSEGGITDSAIKVAIIRNDMVSADANINAAKLDIDSLFEEINGSSKTIKSTRIYFDSEKQTLDAAFKSMSTTVNGLMSTQTSQGTQITAIQGQITSKVWQEDINTAVDEVEGEISTLSTKYTTLNQTVDGLTSTVGTHTTSINSLDTRVDASESNYTQLSNKFSWMVKSGTSATNFTLTDRMAELTAEIVSLNADVKVNGDMIVDGSISAEKLSVTDLSAIGATIGNWTIDDSVIYDYNGNVTTVGAGMQSWFYSDAMESPLANEISFWAGAPFRNRETAPFLVTQSGKLKASDVEISGGSINLKAETNLDAHITVENSNTGQKVLLTPATIRFYDSAGNLEADLFGASGALSLYLNGIRTTYISNMGADIGGTLKATAVKTTSGADLDELNSNMFLNYYYLVKVNSASTTHVTHTIDSARPLSKFDYVIAYVIPNGSTYARGTMIVPRELFITGSHNIECCFTSGGANYYADVKYIDNLHVSIGTNYTNGLTVHVMAMACGRVI